MSNKADGWDSPEYRPMQNRSVFDTTSDTELLEQLSCIDVLPDSMREDFRADLMAEIKRRGLTASN